MNLKIETTRPERGWLEGWVRYAYGCQVHTSNIKKQLKTDNQFSQGFSEGMATTTADMLDAFLTFTSPANRRKAIKIIREMENAKAN